jgi:hypothetical protein
MFEPTALSAGYVFALAPMYVFSLAGGSALDLVERFSGICFPEVLISLFCRRCPLHGSWGCFVGSVCVLVRVPAERGKNVPDAVFGDYIAG